MTTNTTITTTLKTSARVTGSTAAPCISDESQLCSYVNGVCSCTCNKDYVGNKCEYGNNETAATIDKQRAPKRDVYVVISLQTPFQKELLDPSSTDYINLEKKLLNVLTSIFRKVAPDFFVNVIIFGFSEGSVIVNSSAVYAYPNNQTGINFINNGLEGALNSSLVSSLPDISQAVNASASLRNLSATPTTVTQVDQLKEYVNCSLGYSGYKVTCDNTTCFCTGPCFNDPAYCNHRGDCYNAPNGSICQCYNYNFYQYSGQQCELYSQSAGFYGLIFGLIGGVILLLIVLIFTAIFVRKKMMFIWKAERRESKTWFTYDEERTNFQHTDLDALARASMAAFSPKTGKYTLKENPYATLPSGKYVPKLDQVDTTQSFKIKRPEVVMTPTGDR